MRHAYPLIFSFFVSAQVLFTSAVMEVAITLDDSLWTPPLIILFLAALLSSSAWAGLANAGGILLALMIVHGAPVAGAS